jgi:diguanylate cyclase (GGDEF)-like protein
MILETYDNIKFSNIWSNAFKAVEMAFECDDIRSNFSGVIDYLVATTTFKDIQIYKFDKKTGKINGEAIKEDKEKYLEYSNYDMFPDNCELTRVGRDSKLHFLNLSKFSNKYYNYIMLIEKNTLFETDKEKYCEQVIRKIWNLILAKLGYQDAVNEALYKDTLTGVGNRTYYTQFTRDLFKDEKKDITYSLIDLFRLKYINDNYGHKYGDAYIKKAAEIIQEELDDDDKLFRIGGDEFTVISGKLKRTTMLDKYQNVNLKLNKENLGLSIPFPLNINYGVVEGNEELDTFYDKADNRLARQKSKVYKALNIDRRN